MSEIELRKTLIFRIELRQAQPPGRNNFLFPDPDFDDAQSPDFDDAQSPDFDDAQSPDFDDAQSPWEENLKEKFLPQP